MHSLEVPSYEAVFESYRTWRARGLRKSFISRVIIGVTPFRVLITLLIILTKSPAPPSKKNLVAEVTSSHRDRTSHCTVASLD